MQTRTYQNLDRQYLIKQNRKLRMQLKQANTIKQLHQQALISMNQQYLESKIIPILIDIINQTSKSQKVHQLNQKILTLQGNLMVLQKIASQTQQNQKQTYNLLAQQFQKLKQQNIKKQQQLHKFYEKIGQVDYISGLVTKYKQIITTTEQAMAFKKQQEQLLDALNLQQDMIKKLQEERDKLMKINVHMKEEVEKKKDQVRNMTIMFMNDNFNNQTNDLVDTENMLGELQNDNQTQSNENTGSMKKINNSDSTKKLPHYGQVLQSKNSSRSNTSQLSQNFNNKQLNLTSQQLSFYSKVNASQLMSNPNTTLNFIRMQRQLLKDVKQQDQLNSSFSVQSDMDCPQLSILFPDKIQKIIKNKQQIKVPFLNMKKVRQMMAKRQQKMRKQWQQQKHHINPTNKIIQLQTQLEITRKQLANQTLKFRLMSEQLKDLRLKIEQLDKRNLLLVQSNNNLRKNYQATLGQNIKIKQIISSIEEIVGEKMKLNNLQKIKQQIEKFIQQKISKQVDEYLEDIRLIKQQKPVNQNQQNIQTEQKKQPQQAQQQEQWQQFQAPTSTTTPTPNLNKNTKILKKIFNHSINKKSKSISKKQYKKRDHSI